MVGEVESPTKFLKSLISVASLRRRLLPLLHYQTPTRLSFLAVPPLVGPEQRLPELPWVHSQGEVAREGNKDTIVHLKSRLH